MTELTTCRTCDGFIPHQRKSCPHCDAPSAASKLLKLAAGGAIAVTLMACYGAMPQPEEAARPAPTKTCDPGLDSDGDGYCNPDDCDEVNAAIHPGAKDPPGDGIDQNCNGQDG